MSKLLLKAGLFFKGPSLTDSAAWNPGIKKYNVDSKKKLPSGIKKMPGRYEPGLTTIKVISSAPGKVESITLRKGD